MPNADSHDFQAELDLLRAEAQAQLEGHRLAVAEAFQKLTGDLAASHPEGELDAIRTRLTEWEQQETRLVERIAAKTIEHQALGARGELERYRLQLQIAELEKLLALRDAEMRKLKSVLEALMSEHAECSRNLRAAAAAPELEAELQQLKAQLDRSELEAAQLRREIESSLALKLARSVPWLLSPLRALIRQRTQTPGGKS
jgi:chromosome segregation ATPase